MKTLYYICLMGLFISCQNSSESTSNQTQQTEASKQVPTGPEFKSIPQELALKIFNEVDLIDYIFHIYPFSMSQDQKPSIQANVSYISPEAQSYIPANQKPIARQFYAIEGNIFLEADVYFSETDQFYVFIQENKPVYANKMSPAGIQFFNAMISRAMGAVNQGGQ